MEKFEICVTPVGAMTYAAIDAYKVVDFLTIRAGSSKYGGDAFSPPPPNGGNLNRLTKRESYKLPLLISDTD